MTPSQVVLSLETPKSVIFSVLRHTNAESSVITKLARLELYWLIKDLLTSTKQKGWSFARAQVEPFDANLPSSGVEYLPKAIRSDVSAVLKEFLPAKQELVAFRIPLYDQIDTEKLAERLFLSQELMAISFKRKKISESMRYVCNQRFWKNDVKRAWATSDDWIRLAALNLVCPYKKGKVLNLGKNLVIDIQSQNVAKIEGPPYEHWDSIVDVVGLCDSLDCTELDTTPSCLGDRLNLYSRILLLGSSRRELSMSNLDLKTGALTGGIALLDLRQPDGGDNTSNSIAEIIHKAYGLNLAPHFFLSGLNLGRTFEFLCLRKHEIDLRVADIEGDLDGLFEFRRFRMVEKIRNMLPSHKGPNGQKQLRIKETASGWGIVLEGPGYKHCEDFTIERVTPEGKKLQGWGDFEAIFALAFIHASCPKSGERFLDTVRKLWWAQEEPGTLIRDATFEIGKAKRSADEIARITENLPERLSHLWKLPDFDQCFTSMRIEAYLWFLYYLFILENLSYRFWVHPHVRGMLKRKQGRDMPYNSTLQWVSGNPIEHDTSKLVPKPTVYNGPEHLREWFSIHVFKEPFQTSLHVDD